MPAPSKAWFVYLARCADGTLYTGIATDVAARIAAHDSGRGARYTRGRGPLVVCATRRCETKSDALRLELALKRLSRSEKLELTVGRRLARLARAVKARAALSATATAAPARRAAHEARPTRRRRASG